MQEVVLQKSEQKVFEEHKKREVKPKKKEHIIVVTNDIIREQDEKPIRKEEMIVQDEHKAIIEEHPIVKKAYALLGSSLWCEELAQQCIETIGKSAWITTFYEEDGVLIEEVSMMADNFLQIGNKLTLDQIMPGDLLYYADNGEGISHIAVYVGEEKAIHGGYQGRRVVLAGMYLDGASAPIAIRINP